MKNETEFNYAVAHYWNTTCGSIGTYAFHGEVHYGTMKDAKVLLKYCKKQSPERDWKIFQVIEAPQ